MGAGAAGAPGDRITLDLAWVNLSPSSSRGIPFEPAEPVAAWGTATPRPV
jgi:hypothetical protein